MAEVWRVCVRCPFAGPATTRTCDWCRPKSGKSYAWATSGPPAALIVLPLSPDAIRAAFKLGGEEAVVELMGTCNDVAPEHIEFVLHGFREEIAAEYRRRMEELKAQYNRHTHNHHTKK